MLQDSALKKVEKNIRLVIPQLFMLGLLALDLLSFSFFSLGDSKPYLVVMGLYYWAIYRPTLIPIPYCFVLGIIVDLVTGVPLGLYAFLLLFLLLTMMWFLFVSASHFRMSLRTNRTTFNLADLGQFATYHSRVRVLMELRTRTTTRHGITNHRMVIAQNSKTGTK